MDAGQGCAVIPARPRPMADPSHPRRGASYWPKYEPSRKPLDAAREVGRGLRSLRRLARRRWMHQRSGATAVTVYGSRGGPRTSSSRVTTRCSTADHRLREQAEPSRQTARVQLRVHPAGFRRVPARPWRFRGPRAPDKTVPEAIFEAPEEAVIAFLRGLFDADGCVVDQKANGTRYVGLGSRSEELLIGVQELLALIRDRQPDLQDRHRRRRASTTRGRTAVRPRTVLTGRRYRPAHHGRGAA